MQEHIEAVLTDINSRIDSLNSLKAGIIKHLGAPAVPAPALDLTPATAKRMVKSLRKVITKTPAVRNGKSGVTLTSVFRAVIASFAGEFSSESVSNAALAKHPELRIKIGNGTAVTLKFLREKGEIVEVRREGRSIIWKRGKAASATSLQSLHAEIRSEIDSQNKQ